MDPEHFRAYEHVDYRGDEFVMSSWECARDLTKCHHGYLGWGGSWNDYISSVKNWFAFWSVYCYEHVYYGGSWLLVPPQHLIPNLVNLGWNDRISSIRPNTNVTHDTCWPIWNPWASCS